MGTLGQDLRYAFRSLRKSPGFTAAAVVLLALGIGANTAVFSVVHAVLLRPLPYAQPDRLVRMVHDAERSDASLAEYQFWKEHATAYTSVAGYDHGSQDRSLDTGTAFEWIKVTRVTQDFLKTLGVAPALGREFDANETRAGGPQAIILTDGLWRRIFGASPEVLGRVVKLGTTSYAVAGVLPSDFWFESDADALIPLQPGTLIGDAGSNMAMIARLKPGISPRQADAERADLARRFFESAAMKPPDGYAGLTPFSYRTLLTGVEVRTYLLYLAGAAGLLLLIACSNLAGLMLARMAARGKEIAVRLALGSSTGRLLWQSLLENLLLSAAGGLAGLLVASWMLDGLARLEPYTLRTAGTIGLDQPVLWFTFAATLATTVLFSIGPLAIAARMDFSGTLKSGRRGNSGRATARGVLVTGQVALTVTLLVSAALLIQTLYRLHQQELGFTPQGVMTFLTPVSTERQNDAAIHSFEAALLERLKGLPGVRSAAEVNALPLLGWNNFPTEREGHPDQSIGGMEIRRVSSEYFATMGVHIIRGRPFYADDRETSPPVMLVSETLARQWWGQGDPIGDKVVIGRYKGKDMGKQGTSPVFEVVGVVADTRRRDMKEAPRATVYISAEQSTIALAMNWVLRGNFSPRFAQQLRQAVADIDPRQRVERIQTMEDIVASSTATSRFDAWLFGIFAGVALLLTAAGIYGLLAFSVARRTREIGMRMALGAGRARVIRLILGQGLGLIAIGLVAGLAGAAAVARSLSSLLFNVRPADPFSYLVVAVLLLAVGLLASYLPARRAARVDPMVALRSE